MSKVLVAYGHPPLSSAVAVFFPPPPSLPYLIPRWRPFGLQPLSLPQLLSATASCQAAITAFPRLPCITCLWADTTKPLPLVCCQCCCRVTSRPQPLSLLVCHNCPLLWLIVKLSCAGHCRQTIPFCLPPKLLPCCLLSAAVVSLPALPAVLLFDPCFSSLLIALWL